MGRPACLYLPVVRTIEKKALPGDGILRGLSLLLVSGNRRTGLRNSNLGFLKWRQIE
jgi:hypothetical protein